MPLLSLPDELLRWIILSLSPSNVLTRLVPVCRRLHDASLAFVTDGVRPFVLVDVHLAQPDDPILEDAPSIKPYAQFQTVTTKGGKFHVAGCITTAVPMSELHRMQDDLRQAMVPFSWNFAIIGVGSVGTLCMDNSASTLLRTYSRDIAGFLCSPDCGITGEVWLNPFRWTVGLDGLEGVVAAVNEQRPDESAQSSAIKKLAVPGHLFWNWDDVQAAGPGLRRITSSFFCNLRSLTTSYDGRILDPLRAAHFLERSADTLGPVCRTITELKLPRFDLPNPEYVFEIISNRFPSVERLQVPPLAFARVAPPTTSPGSANLIALGSVHTLLINGNLISLELETLPVTTTFDIASRLPNLVFVECSGPFRDTKVRNSNEAMLKAIWWGNFFAATGAETVVLWIGTGRNGNVEERREKCRVFVARVQTVLEELGKKTKLFWRNENAPWMLETGRS
ncbi:hypothetical protein HDU93_008088 [Gonapodya sp. JEL0774]|nr:hypothetical protein HDU93_008088 [Gonapodya sp. JEL0774]